MIVCSSLIWQNEYDEDDDNNDDDDDDDLVSAGENFQFSSQHTDQWPWLPLLCDVV